MVQQQEISREDLEKINRLTRRNLTAQEVYTFKVILCDNDIDRDQECFDDDALQTLAGLFVGKTGICDHEPKSANQQARIYETQVVKQPGRVTADGRPYAALEAKAYMVRTQANEDFIREIDGGIKKEISVGCAVEQAVCSICEADRKKGGCSHQPGQIYGGKLCFTFLRQPTDAYEWSFVAVPAQRKAGVIKQMKQKKEGKTMKELLKQFSGGNFTLTEEQAAYLTEKIKRLEEENGAYHRAVKAKVLCKAFRAQESGEEKAAFARLLDKLETDEMELVGRLLEKAAGSALEEPQTMSARKAEPPSAEPFFI